MYISSCPSLRDLDSTFTHMRTQEVMHTPSCLCFTEYPHRFIHECTSVYSCADKMHVYVQHFFFKTRTYTRQHTYPCTCVVRVCLHLRLHTFACMQASPSMYVPTNMPFTAAPTSTQSRTCTHTHAYTRFDHRSAFTTTSIDICAHTSWRMVIRPMCAHMSLGGMSVHVHTCATRAGLHASVHTSQHISAHARPSSASPMALRPYMPSGTHHLMNTAVCYMHACGCIYVYARARVLYLTMHTRLLYTHDNNHS